MPLLNSSSSILATTWSLLLLFSSLLLTGQAYTDGPYIFRDNDSITIQYVLEGKPHELAMSRTEATSFDVEGLPEVDLTDLDRTVSYQGTYTDVSKIFAFSDVHGQYDLMIDLLKGNDIIDDNLQWSFGDGHMVVTGDNFDRGDKVMDILWFLYDLEKEAEQAGGKVHVLLGNHESMVLTNDLRYLNRKYNYTSGAFRTRYDQFFRIGSVLGDWLTSHNVVTSINGHLFVHGGISPELVEQYPTIDEINKEFISYLIKRDGISSDKRQETLIADQGPIWYRGYFDPEITNEQVLTDILYKLDQNVIVVGHTSFDTISTFFQGKVLGIDCSIKLGEKAAGLLIDQQGYFNCNQQGDRQKLEVASPRQPKTLFDHLYYSSDIPTIDIATNVKRLINRSIKEEYEASISSISFGENSFELQTRVRARGNIRKQVCSNPPLKLDFKSGQLDSMGYNKGSDKLKLVMPCDDRKHNQEKLYDEYALYGLYQLINPSGIRAKLVNLKLRDEKEKKKDFIGFLVEDEEQYAIRHGASVVDKGVISEFALARQSFLRMSFFQYMIANTDWSISSKHNVELVKLPGEKQVIALPYDFDYSGFVGQSYAVPHESLPIESVQDRYFVARKVTEEELKETAQFFISLEQKFHDYIDQSPFWSDKRKKRHHKYIDSFYQIIKKPKSLKRNFRN